MAKNLIIAEQLKKLGFKERPRRPKKKADQNRSKYTAKKPFVKKKQALLNSIQHMDESELPSGLIDSIINAKTVTAITQARKLVTPIMRPRYERDIKERGGKKNYFKLIYIRKK